MKARPLKETKRPSDGNSVYVPCEPSEATHLLIRTPGPWPTRILPVVHGNTTRAGTGCWSWNGDVEKPTLKPSILTGNEPHHASNGRKCHSFVNDGTIQFLSDSTHEFAGKTMDLLDVEDDE